MATILDKFIQIMSSDKYTVEQKKKLARQYYRKHYHPNLKEK